MLVVYFVDFGVTSVVVPTLLRPYFGDIANLGNEPHMHSNDTHEANSIQAGSTTLICRSSPSSPQTASTSSPA